MKKERGFGIIAGISSFFLLLFGISGAFMASIGTCIFCVLPILTFLLSLFGLSLGTILDYNVYFISSGIFFLILTVFLYTRRANCKTCQAKIKK